MRPFALCACASWLWLATTAASAQPREIQRVVVLAPSLDTERDLRAQVSAGLERAHVAVTEPSGVGVVLAACRAASCAGAVLAATHAAFAVVARVTDGSLDLQLTAADGTDAHVALPLGDLVSTTSEAFERARLSLGLGGDGLLRMSSRPVGALLSIDGSVAGVAPSNLRVRPGVHRVAATLEGFEPAEQTLTVEAGRVEPASFQLARSSTLATPGRSSAHDARSAPVLDYVLGGVLVVAALPAIVIPLETLGRDGACDGRSDALGHCREAVHFGTQSAVLLSAGALALAAGAYLFWATPFTVDAAVSSDGAKLAVAGRM